MTYVHSQPGINFQKYNLITPNLHHAREFNQLINKNREHLKKHFLWCQHFLSLEETENFIQTCLQETTNGQAFHYFIQDIQTQSLIGIITIHVHHWEDKVFEFGYWLDQSYWGKGVMTKTLQSIIDQYKRDFPRVNFMIRTYTDNISCQKVALRLKFNFLNEVKAFNGESNGVLRDTVFFGLSL